MSSSQKITPLTALSTVACFLLLSFGVYLTPRDGQTVAVLASSYDKTSAAEIIAQADGLIEDSAFGGRIILARAQTPQFIRRLYAHGAVLVFNPRVLAGCKRSSR